MTYPAKNRRQHERFTVRENLLVANIKLVGTGNPRQAMIVNSSINGVQVSISYELRSGDEIEITLINQDEKSLWKSKQFLGRVCWCTPDSQVDTVFNAGIQFMELQFVK